MRNLKKFLALVLAMMMVFSLTVTVNAAALSDYGDSNTVKPEYQEAVDVLSQLGIFRGTGGNFNPTQILSRAQVSTLIYRVIMGDVEDEQVDIYKNYGKFSDVGDDHWASGYINYAHNGKYVYGDGTGKFNPEDPITGYQLLAILLRAIGYGQNGEYQGTGWDYRSAADASELGITKGINSALLREPISREVVAQIIYNAIGVTMVRYTGGLGYLPLNISGTVDTTGVGLITLTEYADYDDWGAPVIEIEAVWNKVRGHVGEATLECEPVATYTDAVLQCTVTDDVNGGEDFYATVYTNGRFDINNGTGTVVRNYSNTNVGNASTRNYQENVQVKAINTNPKEAVGATGRLTRVFENPLYDSRFKETDELWLDTSTGLYTKTNTGSANYIGYNSKFIIVRIDSLLAEVTKVTKINKDGALHIEKPSELTLKVYDRNTTSTSGTSGTNYTTVVVPNPDKKEDWTYSVGDFLVVFAYQSNGGDAGFVVNENAPQRGRVYTKTGGVNWPNGANSVQHVEVYGLADSEVGAQTVIYKNQHKHDVDGTPIPDNYRYHLDEAGNNTKAYTWYKDPYGNLLGSVEIQDANSYGVVTQLWWADNANSGKGEARANIIYVDGTKSDGYVVVGSVTTSNGDFDGVPGRTYEVAHGTATESGLVKGDYYRVASDYRDNNNNNNGLVNNYLVEISENNDGTKNLKTLPSTYTTVNKNESATTKIGNNDVVYFNAKSLYLVGTRDGKGGVDFVAKSKFPDADYKEVWVDYKNDATGYLAFGLILTDKPAAGNNPSVLTYVNSASYEIHVNGKTQVVSGARAVHEKDLSGDDYYLLTGLLVNGDEKPLKTQSWEVVEALTKYIGGLFYVSFKVDMIDDWCQIGADFDHNAVYYADIYVNGYALTDQEKPGDSARVINATDATQVVIEEESLDWDDVDLNNLAYQSVYVITDDTGKVATRIYVINDTFDSNVKETLEWLALPQNQLKGFNARLDGKMYKDHHKLPETTEKADPGIPSIADFEASVKTGKVTKTITINGTTNNAATGADIHYGSDYVSDQTNKVTYTVPYSVWKDLAGKELTVQVVDKDGKEIDNKPEWIHSDLKVPALTDTLSNPYSVDVKITGTKAVNDNATTKVYKVANFTIEITFTPVGNSTQLVEKDATGGDLVNGGLYSGKAVTIRDLMNLVVEKNNGEVTNWRFFSATEEITKRLHDYDSIASLAYATVMVISEDGKTEELWVITFNNHTLTAKDLYGTLGSTSTAADIAQVVQQALNNDLTVDLDAAVTALKTQGITEVTKVVPALAEIFGAKANDGSAQSVLTDILANGDLMKTNGTATEQLTAGFNVIDAYIGWVVDAAAAEAAAAKAATPSPANARSATDGDATPGDLYGINADGLTVKRTGSGKYVISVTDMSDPTKVTDLSSTYNLFGLPAIVTKLEELSTATSVTGYPTWDTAWKEKGVAKSKANAKGDYADGLESVLSSLVGNGTTSDFAKKDKTDFVLTIKLSATQSVTFSIVNNVPAT